MAKGITWSKEDTKRLFSIVARERRQGITMREAIETAANEMRRSSISVSRHYYKASNNTFREQQDILKIDGRTARWQEPEQVQVNEAREVTISEGKEILTAMEAFMGMFNEIKNENAILKREISALQQQLEMERTMSNRVRDDYDAMARIMDRARQMIVNEELGEREAVKLKADRNGNLERVV